MIRDPLSQVQHVLQSLINSCPIYRSILVLAVAATAAPSLKAVQKIQPAPPPHLSSRWGMWAHLLLYVLHLSSLIQCPISFLPKVSFEMKLDASN